MKLALILILLFVHISAQATKLLVVTEDLSPLNYVEDDTIIGHHTYVVNSLLKMTGIDYSITAMPWARSYKIALMQPNVLIYTINHTQERHDKFHWIGQFPTKLDIDYYALKSSNIENTTMSQLKQLRIGTQINTANDVFVTNNGFVNISRVSHIDQTIGMLERGRIDIVIASQHQIQQASKNTGLDFSKLIKVSHALSSRPSIAASLSTPKEIVSQLQQAYLTLSKNTDMCELMKIEKSLCIKATVQP